MATAESFPCLLRIFRSANVDSSMRESEVGVSFAEAVVLAESNSGHRNCRLLFAATFTGQIQGRRCWAVACLQLSAAIAEVDVDPDTGIVVVERIWIAHDIGKSINPMLVMGQVEGSVYMGLGEILMEEMAYRANRNVVHKVPSMLEYKSPTTMEMCDVKTYLIEDPDPNGPYGAKEVGRDRCCLGRPRLRMLFTMQWACALMKYQSRRRKFLKALREKAKGRDGRYGPDTVPSVEWPEPLRVLTPPKA